MTINGVLALMIIGSFLVAMALHELGHTLMRFGLERRRIGKSRLLAWEWQPRFAVLGALFCIVLAFQPLFPVGLGWGKPRQVVLEGEQTPVLTRIDRALIALAGPLSSFIIGALVAFGMHFLAPFLLGFDTLVAQRILQAILVFACVNMSLALFNLIPLYPLDGYQVIHALRSEDAPTGFIKFIGFALIFLLFFFLPFLAQLSGGVQFPLFLFPTYILLGAFHLVAAIMHTHTGWYLVNALYFS